jgi:hypothetical protein
MDESLLVGPALVKSGLTAIAVLPSLFYAFVTIRGQVIKLTLPGPYALSSLQRAFEKRFRFDLGTAAWKTELGDDVPVGRLRVGLSNAEPICFTADGEILQTINLLQYPEPGDAHLVELSLSATVQTLLGRLGPGTYTFANNSQPVFEHPADLLTDSVLTGDPIHVTRTRGSAAPKLISQCASGPRRGGLSCDVVFADGSRVTVDVPENAKVSDVIDRIRGRLNGRRPIVTSLDDDPVPMGFRLSVLEEPRTLVVNLGEPDGNAAAPPPSAPLTADPHGAFPVVVSPRLGDRAGLTCEVVFADHSCEIVRVPETATIAELVDLIAERLNGRRAIVTTPDEDEIAMDFLVSALEEPRTILIDFARTDVDPPSSSRAANRSITPIALIHRGKVFPVRRSLISENLKLFRDHPSLLEAESYEVESSVPVDVFVEFLKSVEGETINITDSNASLLLQLCSEFGFEKLREDCESVIRLGWTKRSRLSSFLPRIEEVFVDRESRPSPDFLSLENRVSKLEARLSRLEGVAGDGLYRRGLELIRGPAEFKVDPELGLASLKAAADCGHGDSAFWYGEYKREGLICAQNARESAESYRISAEHGCELGRRHFGLCLRYGFGVSRNLQEASNFVTIPPDRFLPPGGEVGESAVPFCGGLGALRLHPRDRLMDPNWRDRGDLRKLVNRSTNEISLARVVKYRDRARFMEELERWRSLNHPNLVGKIGFYHQFETRNQQAIVMEWQPRGSLAELLDNSAEWAKVSATDKMKMIVGLVLVVRYLHGNNFVHGGLHLDCIRLSEDLEVRLEAFRYLPQLIDPESGGEPDLGFAAHAAPESIRGGFKGKPGLAEDVYGLGIILWEILTGVAFVQQWGGSASADRISRDIASGTRPDTSGLSDESRELVSGCWAGRAGERPTADDVFERLKTVKYQLLPGVDSTEIGFYVDSVVEREKAFRRVVNRPE